MKNKKMIMMMMAQNFADGGKLCS